MKNFKFLLIFGVLLHLLAAYFSLGWWQTDEHFQILEWASAWKGWTSTSGLEWEYPAQMRSWIVPAILGELFGFLKFMGLENPVNWERAARLLAVILALYSSWCCVKSFSEDLKKEFGAPKAKSLESRALIFCFVGALMPFFHARISAEALSTSIFLLALAERNKRSWLSGFWAGLAFVMRFQTGFLSVALGVFYAQKFWKRNDLISLIKFGLGFLLANGLGLVVDRLGYGVWTWSNWNYLHQNIFEGKADKFGVHPWWDYLKLFVVETPPFGLITLACMIFLWVKKPGHILSVASFVFFVLHTVVGHKEFRFMTPLFWMAPLFYVYAVGSLNSKVLRYLHLSLLALGLLWAIPSSVVSRRGAELSFFENLWNKSLDLPQSFKLYQNPGDGNPFGFWGAKIWIYKPVGLEIVHLNGTKLPKEDFLFFTEKREAPVFKKRQCELEVNSVPAWLPASLQESIQASGRVMRVWKCSKS